MKGNQFEFAGRAARRRDAALADNPHKAGTPAHQSWAAGWHAVNDGAAGPVPGDAPKPEPIEIRTGPLSPEDTETLVRMWKAGAPGEEIARALHRYVDDVWRLVAELRDKFGLPLRAPGSVFRGSSKCSRALPAGEANADLRRRANPARARNAGTQSKRRRYTDEENDLIWRLSTREGRTPAQIAAAIGRTPKATEQQLSVLRKQRAADDGALYRRRVTTRWSEDRAAALIRLWNQGLELKDMETPLNASAGAIKKQIAKLRRAGCTELPLRAPFFSRAAASRHANPRGDAGVGRVASANAKKVAAHG